MNSGCVKGCLDDVVEIPMRLKHNFLSLHQWPESDAEFIRLLGMKDKRDSRPRRMRGGASCESFMTRQMYLRSYPFSRKENMPQRIRKCFARGKKLLIRIRKNMSPRRISSLLKDLKSCSIRAFQDALLAVFSFLLACTTSIDVKLPE